jgi:hypothetical protein
VQEFGGRSDVTALWNSLKEIQRDGFQSLSNPYFEHVLDNLRHLRVTEKRLEQRRSTTIRTQSS